MQDAITKQATSSASPSSANQGIFDTFKENIMELDPASSDFEREANIIFMQLQESLGIESSKRINLANFALIHFPSISEGETKFNFLDFSLKDIADIKKYKALVSIEGQKGVFGVDLSRFQGRYVNNGELVIIPKFIAPAGSEIGKFVACQDNESTKFVVDTLKNLAVNATSPMEKSAGSTFLSPEVSEMLKIIKVLSEIDGFDVRRFKPNTVQPPYSNAGHNTFGFASNQSLVYQHLATYNPQEGSFVFFGNRITPLFDKVPKTLVLNSIFPHYVDDGFPQFDRLLQAQNQDNPISIMRKFVETGNKLDDRLGAIDLMLIKLTQHLSIKNGGSENFAKYAKDTEDFKDFLRIFMEKNCSDRVPSQLPPRVGYNSTFAHVEATPTIGGNFSGKVTSFPEFESFETPSPEQLDYPDSTPISAPLKSTPKPQRLNPETIAKITGDTLLDKMVMLSAIEVAAISVGFLNKLMLLKVDELNEKQKNVLSSWLENFSRIIGIGNVYGKDAVLPILALPILVSSYKTLEASAEKIGLTPPSEALKKMTEGVIGSEAQERITEIYQNTPEYAKLIAKQFAFVSAIHFLGNLIEDDRENKLTYSQSLILSSTTALCSALARVGFNYLENKIGNYFQVRDSGAQTPPASQTADSIMERGVQPAVNGDLVTASHRDSRENGDSVRGGEISLAPQNLNSGVGEALRNQSQLVEVQSGIFVPQGLIRDTIQAESDLQPAEGVNQQISSVQAPAPAGINIAEFPSLVALSTFAILGGVINLSQSFQVLGQSQTQTQTQTPTLAPAPAGSERGDRRDGVSRV